MRIGNTENHYGLIAILFHWIMALILIGLVGVGLYMTSGVKDDFKYILYDWHKSFGVLILVFVIFRLSWRLSNIIPTLNGIPFWERVAARSIQWIFYFLMFALPITGWLMGSAAGHLPVFFGLFKLPALLPVDIATKKCFAHIHNWLAYGLIAAFCLHVGAAFKHHFINKNNVLKRMIVFK